MALKIPWKTLSKPASLSAEKLAALSSERRAFFVVVGLFLVVGIALRSIDYFNQPEVARDAPATDAAPAPTAAATPAVEPAESSPKPQPQAQETATAPNEQAAQPGEAVGHAEQPGLDSGLILVARRPIEVLSAPSPTASAMYGFPAGRQFRLIGREGGFAHIQDLNSKASGWVDEAALSPPPRVPDVSSPSQAKPDAVSRKRVPADPKPKPTRRERDRQVTADSPEPVQPRRRPGLFGEGGPFRGIFGN
jgi:hypothetical protein